ncbi:DUF2905 domain-containing protein [Aureibacter tunicatorum]|uniref:DUF2905 domain-containing protein n=1 Tax=Aureibacter tunicatorum TaxID=866807 RepID=UPI00286AD797|nr:DUF2905 domain-containing protein [Aureibacter tunicatorum]
MAKTLIIIGILLIIAGLTFYIPGFNIWNWLGRLPGDFSYKSKNMQFYFPLGTSILLSILLSAIFWIISKIS